MKLYETIHDNRIYSIAELSANHGNNLDHALEIVRAAAKSGADCLKTQTYTADTITLNCNNAFFQIKTGLWAGQSFYDLYSRASMPWEWNSVIKRECERLGMDFLSTPFDKTAVDYLESINVEMYKIASFELIDIPLIEYTASKGKPMIISCGMGSLEEITEAVEACHRQNNSNIVLLKCCSEYPAAYDDMNLSLISDMKKRFGVPVGLSDHTLGSVADIAAVSLGAQVIEKHFCLSRNEDTPDAAFSTEPDEFLNMVQDVNIAARMRGRATYQRTEKEEVASKKRRSIFASCRIEKGEKFTEENCKSVRPGLGLKPKYYSELLGKTAKRTIEFGEPITLEDL